MSLKKLGFLILVSHALYSVCQIATAMESGDWLIRSRFATVYPDYQARTITYQGLPTQNSGTDMDESYTLEADITYMIAKHWGVELSADSSSKHTLTADNRAFFPFVQKRIGETRLLPSALVVQYHLVPDATISPYAGLGAHYALFFDEKLNSSLDANVDDVSTLKFNDTVGLVAQVGADYNIDNDWVFNIDFKYLNIDTSAHLSSTVLGKVDIDMDIDPWIIGFGMGRRF